MTESPAARVAEQAQALADEVRAGLNRIWLQDPEDSEVKRAALDALAGLLSVVETLQQERDGRYRQLRAIQRWFNEQSAELVAVREDVTRLRGLLTEWLNVPCTRVGLLSERTRAALVVSSPPPGERAAPQEASE